MSGCSDEPGARLLFLELGAGVEYTFSASIVMEQP